MLESSASGYTNPMIASAGQFRGQEKLRALLARYMAQGRVSGTLLLLGQRGLGKTTLATIIARALCCEKNQGSRHKAQGANEAEQPSAVTIGNDSIDAQPMSSADSEPGIADLPLSPSLSLEPCALRLDFCGSCYACRSIASGNQPEFVVIRPKGQDIKAEQLDDDLDGLRSASLHPVNLPWRIFLFDDAHFLNNSTANQLLKLLEEPPARTLFILTTDQPDKLLPTIRSRGVPFSLTPLPRWQLEEFIGEELPQASARCVREAARMAGGRYVDALALADNADWRGAVCVLAQALARRRDVPECAAGLQEHEFAALWAKELADSGLTDDEAQKQLEKPRVNELKRQALALAYDRAAWQLLADAARGLEHYSGAERRRSAAALPGPRFGAALALLKARIHSNVDPQLAQAAFEGSI